MMSGSDQLNGMSTDSRNNLPEYNEKHALQVFQAAATIVGQFSRQNSNDFIMN